MRAHLYARVSIYKLNYDVFIRAREFSSANTYVQIKRLPFFHVRLSKNVYDTRWGGISCKWIVNE